MCREELDLEKLLGGNPFTVSSALSYNGFAVTVPTLIDTGANGQVFIDTNLAIDLAKAFGRKVYKLPFTCGTRTFDGKAGPQLTHVILLHLWLDEGS